MQEDGHIGFSYFVERAKRTKIWSKVLTIFSGIFGITFCFLFFLENFRIMRMAIKFNWLTRGQIQIPVLYLYIIMSVGSLMLLITFLMKIVMGLFDLKEYGSSTEYLGRTLE
jgi:TRAP-type C4-dicarboxylate transport system permease small subunit